MKKKLFPLIHLIAVSISIFLALVFFTILAICWESMTGGQAKLSEDYYAFYLKALAWFSVAAGCFATIRIIILARIHRTEPYEESFYLRNVLTWVRSNI